MFTRALRAGVLVALTLAGVGAGGHMRPPLQIGRAGGEPGQIERVGAEPGQIARVGADPRVGLLTFTKDIAPIVWARCATCHRPGEIGPFSLITYDDVRRHATQIAAVTARRVMPPWKPAPGRGSFQNERRLSDAELDAIQTWIAAGAPEGEAADLPALPLPLREAQRERAWQLGTPDLIVTMPAPYTVAADGADVFRTFVIPIPVAAARYVRALEFHPGNARVVHHANLGVDRTRSSRALDARDPEPGYSGSMERDARYPEGQLLGWTPGQAAHAVPDGTQWRLEPGSDLVVQLHLQPTGKRESLQVTAGFYFTDVAPTRSPIGLRLGSETIDICCPSTSRCSRSSRTRTTSRARCRRWPSCPAAACAG